MDVLHRGVEVSLGENKITIKPGMAFRASARDMRDIKAQLSEKERARLAAQPSNTPDSEIYSIDIQDRPARLGVLGSIASLFGRGFDRNEWRDARVVLNQPSPVYEAPKKRRFGLDNA